jgi:hypothetical protein
MDVLDLYKEHYFFEINRRDQLTSQLSIPIGILTILGGLGAYLANTISICSKDMKIVFIAILAISTLFFIITIYYLIRSYYGYTYRYIPTPKEIDDYRKQLKEYHERVGNSEEQVIIEIKEFLTERYAISTHKNTWNNDSKSGFLHKANKALIYTLVSLLLNASLFFWINSNNHVNNVQKVEIINFDSFKKRKDIIMPDDQQQQQEQGQDQGQSQDQGQQQIERPAAPPDRLIKEDTQPKETRNE